MAEEAKSAEFTLVYNLDGKGYAVGLTKEQHQTLQMLLVGLGKIEVYRKIEVEYKINQ